MTETMIIIYQEGDDPIELTLSEAQYIYRKLDEVFSTKSGAQMDRDKENLERQLGFVNAAPEKNLAEALGMGRP